MPSPIITTTHSVLQGTPQDILRNLKTSATGLSHKEALKRLKQYGYNEPTKKKQQHIVIQFLRECTNPLVITLLLIATFSFMFGEKMSGLLVGFMALASVSISFIKEHHATKDVQHLIDAVRVTVTVLRDKKIITIPMRDVVQGDMVQLSAGDNIPADVYIISAKDFYVNQSTFTGESFPIQKFVKPQTTNTGIPDTIALMGSYVVSGTAEAVVYATGTTTNLGTISQELAQGEPPTSFDIGIRDFTLLMIRFMVILASVVFVINVASKGNIVEAFLFALAVAVGLAPEMLPMEVTINLSKSAIDMAHKGVIIKRLDAMQNFGAMDILCTDKTGTLTLDEIVLVQHMNALGEEDEDVMRMAYVNSYYQTGLHSMLDRAVLKHEHLKIATYKKIDELPFDFERKVMSVAVTIGHKHRMITKGAPEELLQRCTHCAVHGEVTPLTKLIEKRLLHEYTALSSDGFRVLALGYNDYPLTKTSFAHADEHDLIFKGFVAFLDPPKPTVTKTIQELHQLGVQLKILSGDNELVTQKICSEVRLELHGVMTGTQLEKLSDQELQKVVNSITVFARVNPLQKERVIKALRAKGYTVGFLGDGINDTPALKAADVGISVNNAISVAKETADIILLRKSLSVLKDCITDGRATFGNIVKYIKMGASSNFGNMFSMIGASLLLPFLPMRPIQILLNNFLYDMSQLSLPTDGVDPEYVTKPRPWNITAIKKFMTVIGPLSSIYDYLTFAMMWFLFHANTVAQQAVFQTGWFLESLASQTLVIYIIRTNKIPFIQSKPSKALVITTLSVLVFAFMFVASPWGAFLGFVQLPWQYFAILPMFLVTYLGLVQVVKMWFIKKYEAI